MSGTIIENLSGRKLSVLVTVLLICQLCCFLVGLIAPQPATTEGILTTVCLDKNWNPNDLNYWITRDNCHRIQFEDHQAMDGVTPDQLVFMAHMPILDVDFSRWQQNLVGVLELDVVYQEGDHELNTIIELTLNSRLAYSDRINDNNNNKKKKKRTPWQYFAHAEEKRFMHCHLDPTHINDLNGYPYNCTMVPLFELGTLYHDYYLLNLRLPVDEKLNKNLNLRKIADVHLHTIHMNGGFTRVWIGIKTFFFPLLISIMYWFWQRVHKLSRTPVLLEYMLIGLGGTLLFLDLPIEYLTLIYNMPYMLLLSDIRQGVFYAMLLSFWLVFAGEHMLIQDNHSGKNTIKTYWKHLSTIIIGCLSLLIFDLSERGIQLINPFYSIWVTRIGTNLALSFIILAGISAGLYFIFLCYMVWCVFKNITLKRSILPQMSQARRLHYEGIIYRFNFLMLTTIICAAITIISFILSQVSDGQHHGGGGWNGDDDDIDDPIQITSALHTGVYGMWNVYICGMLILYAPSHKQWPNDILLQSTNGGGDDEHVEFNRLQADVCPNEISSLTSFTSKASIE